MISNSSIISSLLTFSINFMKPYVILIVGLLSICLFVHVIFGSDSTSAKGTAHMRKQSEQQESSTIRNYNNTQYGAQCTPEQLLKINKADVTHNSNCPKHNWISIMLHESLLLTSSPPTIVRIIFVSIYMCMYTLHCTPLVTYTPIPLYLYPL